ncbi:MAG: hypothetical protein MZW92_29875 [Comamonadaceae bacterium]|nr:hypothetical protein [Comamonadaceae bacterium]
MRGLNEDGAQLNRELQARVESASQRVAALSAQSRRQQVTAEQVARERRQLDEEIRAANQQVTLQQGALVEVSELPDARHGRRTWTARSPVRTGCWPRRSAIWRRWSRCASRCPPEAPGAAARCPSPACTAPSPPAADRRLPARRLHDRADAGRQRARRAAVAGQGTGTRARAAAARRAAGRAPASAAGSAHARADAGRDAPRPGRDAAPERRHRQVSTVQQRQQKTQREQALSDANVKVQALERAPEMMPEAKARRLEELRRELRRTLELDRRDVSDPADAPTKPMRSPTAA